MELTKLTLAEFLCDGNSELAPADPDAFANVEAVVRDMVGEGYAVWDQGMRFMRYEASRRMSCCYTKARQSDVYWGELLTIREDHKGKYLTVPLVLEVASRRPLPERRKMSKPGMRALEKAWRVANGYYDNPWP